MFSPFQKKFPRTFHRDFRPRSTTSFRKAFFRLANLGGVFFQMFDLYQKTCWRWFNLSNTVDGWNPAPPGMYETLWTMGYLSYQLVQDFFHQQDFNIGRFHHPPPTYLDWTFGSPRKIGASLVEPSIFLSDEFCWTTTYLLGFVWRWLFCRFYYGKSPLGRICFTFSKHLKQIQASMSQDVSKRLVMGL